jgi:hypothetical protein
MVGNNRDRTIASACGVVQIINHWHFLLCGFPEKQAKFSTHSACQICAPGYSKPRQGAFVKNFTPKDFFS